MTTVIFSVIINVVTGPNIIFLIYLNYCALMKFNVGISLIIMIQNMILDVKNKLVIYVKLIPIVKQIFNVRHGSNFSKKLVIFAYQSMIVRRKSAYILDKNMTLNAIQKLVQNVMVFMIAIRVLEIICSINVLIGFLIRKVLWNQ